MKKIISLFWLSLLIFYAPQTASADEAQKAIQTVEEISSRAINILKDQAGVDAKRDAFTKLLQDHADIRRTARFVIGKYARTVSKEELDTFQNQFLEMLVNVYTNRLTEFNDEKIIIGKAQTKGKNAVVSSRIVFPSGREPITIDWWMVRKKNGSYKLFDIRVLGIWLAQEQRATFISILDKNNGDLNALIAHIQSLTKTTPQ